MLGSLSKYDRLDDTPLAIFDQKKKKNVGLPMQFL